MGVALRILGALEFLKLAPGLNDALEKWHKACGYQPKKVSSESERQAIDFLARHN